ncbi:halocarboxylic acid dehydrogenase DehI family protein [Halorussus gelatinilyticus]|uniref:Halocarboxylic acid dehydrogenase DehI family protein n=1 Tax=Halorussus gelatinilyticus TaxID=2937524 RepID=A0A8U0IDT7_9EURY|nr:halocarboxylic acid dehydrogenase DehI family protein [Halorussus gelatinilyticus]UPV99102.1 halocarboxylic acid dehydrogenase DehI family protein [Halorussus gelatinilyticus]
MDTDKQLYEHEAEGWRRGVYEDVTATFRAPVVNWIFRTLMANDPDFTRYLWGQVKPAFETRAFGRYSVVYRDAVLSAIEESTSHADGDGPEVTRYRRADLDLRPAEFRELRGQVATFDVVAPRLAALFEIVDRSLQDGSVGSAPVDDSAATEPMPSWLDRGRGRSPTMVDAPPDELDDTVERIRTFHGLDDNLPSIYRCLAQWPPYLRTAWDDLEPTLESAAFDRACERSSDETAAFVDSLAYPPRLSPDDLRARGMDDEAVSELRELFETFNRGPIETVLPALPVYALTLGAAGRRETG